MEQKIRKLIHPFGNELETPILVPSYSSKGFGKKASKNGRNISAVTEVMENCAQFLTEITLVSAYDLYYEYLIDINKFATTETVLIDSGGYETSPDFDLSSPKQLSVGHEPWDLEKYVKVLDEWPEQYPNIIVSFDHEYKNTSFENQVESAKKLFRNYPNSLHDFLIKPFTKNSKYVEIEKDVNSNINLLKGFDIIGVTEVELGNSLLQRMKRIKKLRTSLTESGLDTPIHVFGSLDPITSILYFLSGADIFDGLTWIRYAYFKGIAMYPSNASFLDEENGGANLHDQQLQTMQLFHNLSTLSKMKVLMQKYIRTSNISVFNDLGIPNFGERLESLMNNLKD